MPAAVASAVIGEGEISIVVPVRRGRAAVVDVSTTRRADLPDVFRGKPVLEALAAAPRLFSLCRNAHAVAARKACEAALGLTVSPTTAARRRLLCALEALDNEVFQMCTDWPQRLCRQPDFTLLRQTREATRVLRDTLLAGRGTSPAELRTLHRIVDALAPEASVALDVREWTGWVRTSPSVTAAFARALMDDPEALVFGLCDVPLVPLLTSAWFDAQAFQSGSRGPPTLDGRPAEAGALSLASEEQGVAQELKLHGRTLKARLLGHLASLRAWVLEIDAAISIAPGAVSDVELPPDSGQGTGVVTTSRGLLAHSIQLEGGKVAGWRIVAPTDWTFHPGGVVPRALQGAKSNGLRMRAEWLIGLLDPCVPCSLHIEEPRRA